MAASVLLEEAGVARSLSSYHRLLCASLCMFRCLEHVLIQRKAHAR